MAKRKLGPKAWLKRIQDSQPPQSNKRAIVNYDHPMSLARLGPMIKGSWGVPEALERQLIAAGRPVPKPVVGFLLLDTGASLTCMALDVAHELGLTPIRLQKTGGAGGIHENEVFQAYLRMIFVDSFGNGLQVNRDREVMGIPRLGDFLTVNQVKSQDNYPTRLVGLLGRDFLLHTTLTYRGSSGLFELEIHDTTIPDRPARS